VATDLRIGARFSGDTAIALDAALKHTAETIKRMPAQYACYPNGGPIFPFQRFPTARRALAQPVLTLDDTYLETFGSLLVPRNIWRALQRFGHWIEPSLIAEWIRLMKTWAANQERQLNDATIALAMTWSDPARDTIAARQIALAMFERGKPITCVWSGKNLTRATFDVDHCFPWSAWPCDDLWNLMPAHRTINQHQKKGRLPTESLLGRAKDNILRWWEAAYLDPAKPVMASEFKLQAHASLAALAGNRSPGPDDVFGAMRTQRLRLWRDQQVPEWNG
jgi:hypothetical protein